MLASELVSAVRRQGAIVASVADSDILAAADIELKGVVWPYLRSINSDFGVREALLTPVNGRATLPRRAVGAALRHVQTVIGGVYTTLAQVALEQDAGQVLGGYPYGFYVDAGAIVLVPRGSGSQLRVRYWPRPGALALETDATKFAPILAASAVNDTTTFLNALPLVSPELTEADVISGASHHALLALNSAVFEQVNGYNIATANLFDLPTTGDWVCLAGYTPVVPVPEELFSPLVYLTAASLQRALGYISEADSNQNEGMQRMELCRDTLAPRIQGNPARLTGGTYAGMGRGWGWGGGWGGRRGWGW